MEKISATLLLFALVACGPPQPTEQQAMPVAKKDTAMEKQALVDTIAMPPRIDTAFFPVSREIVGFIKQKDLRSLARFIHPQKGLCFSPYAHIDTLTCQKFSTKELQDLSRTKKFKWGTYDGSGKVILLTVPDYFDHFVYDADFLVQAQIEQNDFLNQGNSFNNLKEVFPGCDFTDFFIKGTEPNHGMDWRTLRLVFKTENGIPYLVAIVHDQWTS